MRLRPPYCMDRRCGRTEPEPCSGLCDADVLRASQLQHSVQHVGREGHRVGGAVRIAASGVLGNGKAPSEVPVWIRSRSTSASPLRTAIISRPVLVEVSAQGSADDRNCPPAFTMRLMIANRSK